MMQVFEFVIPLDCLTDSIRETIKGNKNLKYPHLNVTYSFEYRFKCVLCVSFPPELFGFINYQRIDELKEQIEIAARHHFESKYEKPKSISTVELAEQFNNGQYE